MLEGEPGGREGVDTEAKDLGGGSGWEGCSTLGRCSVVRTVFIEFLGLAPPAAWLLGGALGRGGGMEAFGLERRALSRRFDSDFKEVKGEVMVVEGGGLGVSTIRVLGEGRKAGS